MLLSADDPTICILFSIIDVFFVRNYKKQFSNDKLNLLNYLSLVFCLFWLFQVRVMLVVTSVTPNNQCCKRNAKKITESWLRLLNHLPEVGIYPQNIERTILLPAFDDKWMNWFLSQENIHHN
jgi:hypothetical protein